MHILEIAALTHAEFLSKSEDHQIDVLSYDSRKLRGTEQELFFAFESEKNDGHSFLLQAHRRGTRNFIVQKKVDLRELKDANVLLVQNSLSTLHQIAKAHRELFTIPVVGITGSNGKTIVKEWLATLLEESLSVVKSPKSFNSQIGVPLSVWQLEKHHEIAVFEAGISKPGEMEPLNEIIQPTLGIFTNIGDAHDENFKSREEKINEKALLYKNCDAILSRYDHKEINEVLKKLKMPVIRWGIDQPDAELNYTQDESVFSVTHVGQKWTFKNELDHPQDQENIFTAISAAILLGLGAHELNKGLSKIRPVKMRLELKRGINECYILDDSYNNDLQGLEIALDYLLQQPKKEKISVILSDILQSSTQYQVLYQKVNQLLKKRGIHRLIGIGPSIEAHSNAFDLPTRFYTSSREFLMDPPDFRDEMILVKGARAFALEKIVAFLEEKSHGTILEINNEAILNNLSVYQKKMKPNVRLMVMVKAFAYGVGVNEVAHLLAYHQVDYLGVAYLDEAITLRRKGIKLPILIMNPEWSAFSLLESFDLEPEIYSLEMLHALLDSGVSPRIHIKIETGMNRLGFTVDDLPELISLLQSNPQLQVTGIFTHFSSSEDPEEDEFTKKQAMAFDQAYDEIVDALGYSPIKHALNSSGILRWPEYQFDMVRLGIGLYGYDSSGTFKGLAPISTLKSRISQIKSIKKGDSIGYSRIGRAQKDGQVATIAIGYADGYSRAFSNGNAYVKINGQKARTIGNVCMDMTMIDVTGLKVKVGDEVIIFGKDPSIEQLADWANTIPYEILTNVSQRVKRVFVSE